MAVKTRKIPLLPPMTTPAVVTMVGYALMVFLVLIPIDMYMYDSSKDTVVKQEYNFWQRLVIALLLSFPFILSVYSVNCMMVGACKLWSWIVAIFTIIWAIFMTITTVMNKSFSLNSLTM